MSYCADFNGTLNCFAYQNTEEIENIVSACFDKDGYSLVRIDKTDRRILSIVLFGNGKYHEDEWWGFLNAIEPHVKDGSIEFVGEDNSFWRFVLRRNSDEGFVEENGYVVYEPAKAFSKRKNILVYDKDTKDKEPLLLLKTREGIEIEGIISDIWMIDGYTLDMLIDEIDRLYGDSVEIEKIDEQVGF